ncbi:ABC transporter permease [Corynebacterium otitidis]|uniref:ABC transporter permease n=1 Tax=Corynebacterium otitidis TaxID=29321 RepID=UPI0006281E7F|nr:spermidine/putrescine ABC transporter permease [Corynebacterium otitidis]KKO84321.1 spermidine/putrescine ABC transporter permease [Corynebacterium otitidis]
MTQGLSRSQPRQSHGHRDSKGKSTRAAAVSTLAPLTIIVACFLVLPILGMAYTSFRTSSGDGFTLENYAALAEGNRGLALKNSPIVSGLSALIATVVGLVVAAAISTVRSTTVDAITGIISSVLANSGGAPLAFSFIVLLGNTGYLIDAVTAVDGDFSLYSLRGLVIMYQYFLIPTMVLLTLPSFRALRTSWREANTSLGGSAWTFWRRVGMPILAPTVLGAAIMLFGAAFATHASAAVLMGTGSFPLVTLQIANELSGSAASGGRTVAMAMGMVTAVVAVVTLVAFTWLQNRSRRWQL